MKKYIGTKQVQAEPMTRAEYNTFRGWQLPADENGEDAGYLVEYLDGGKPNVVTHAGYVSWSPKEQFDAAYMETTGLTFGLALEALRKSASRVARTGWNGKNMYIFYVPGKGKQVQIHHTIAAEFAVGSEVLRLPYIAMRTADQTIVPWLASQTDILATDWEILE